MRHLIVTALALAAPALARPDGVGGHHEHGHHADHAAAAVAPSAPGAYQELEPQYAPQSLDYNAGNYANYDYSPEPSRVFAPARQDSGVDLSQLLIPILIIAGLALLFPSITEVDVNATGRKRRSAEGDASPLANMVGRVQDMYSAILQSEECIERVACEVGGLASDAGISKSLTKAAEGFVPKKFNKMMKNFNHGKDCSKNNKCGVF